MRIRPARPDDADAVGDLVQRAYGPYVPRIGRRPAPMDDDYGKKVRDGGVFIADDVAPIGVIVLITGADHVLIENVAVDPDRQGEGIGRVLLALAETRALEAGTPVLRLYTNAAMTENLAFYSRLGYQETDRRSDDGFERVFFTKHLAPIG